MLEVVSGEMPRVTRDKSFAARRAKTGSANCTTGDCTSVVQSAGASTRSTGPKGDWSRPMTFAPSAAIVASAVVASAANKPRVKAVPGGSGCSFTASPSREVCSL